MTEMKANALHDAQSFLRGKRLTLYITALNQTSLFPCHHYTLNKGNTKPTTEHDFKQRTFIFKE